MLRGRSILRFFKIFCISAACFMLLIGCSTKPEKVEPERLEQSETVDKAEKDEIENMKEKRLDLSNAFHDINGCAVLYSPSENTYFFYNKDLAEQEVSPYSTFKIISTLAGLHNNIIEDETSTMNYNGTEYPNPEWNDNLTLQTAFQTSCIWYFRQIIDSVGEDEIKKELTELGYGNCDISEWEGSHVNPYEELNGFWLNSSLKISTLDQVKMLSDIFEGESIYDSESIEILKKIMLIQDNKEQKIYGKTGSGSNGEAWFVGFAEKEQQRRYFAIYLSDSAQAGQISGSTAKEIALKIIE